jgi:membrane associated rhomboid family serine protease
MIPFKDDNPTERFPYLTIGLIGLNVIVYLFEVFHPAGLQYVVYKYGAVPRYLVGGGGDGTLLPPVTVFTSMFMHGGLLHLGGNMLYLWIFGDNLEDRLGRIRFLVFYLLSGVVAAYAHAFSAPGSTIPMIGASGAVAGVLGAYLLLYPRAKVHTLIFFGFFVDVIRVPALIVIGFWGIIQLVNGLISKGLMAQGGVAWFAHIGGFLFGLLTIRYWVPGRRRGRRWTS